MNWIFDLLDLYVRMCNSCGINTVFSNIEVSLYNCTEIYVIFGSTAKPYHSIELH